MKKEKIEIPKIEPKYVIVSGTDIESKINAMIENGYAPVGGISVLMGRSEKGFQALFFYQAVIKTIVVQ